MPTVSVLVSRSMIANTEVRSPLSSMALLMISAWMKYRNVASVVYSQMNRQMPSR